MLLVPFWPIGHELHRDGRSASPPLFSAQRRCALRKDAGPDPRCRRSSRFGAVSHRRRRLQRRPSSGQIAGSQDGFAVLSATPALDRCTDVTGAVENQA